MICILVFSAVLKQMAYILGRQQVVVDLSENLPIYEREDIQNISSNTYLNPLFHLLGREVFFIYNMYYREIILIINN